MTIAGKTHQCPLSSTNQEGDIVDELVSKTDKGRKIVHMLPFGVLSSSRCDSGRA